ncbi:hypothetical protein Tco_1565281 [Tanacetum coccineum]
MPIRGIRNPNSGGYKGMASEGFEPEDYTRVSSFMAAPKDSNDTNAESCNSEVWLKLSEDKRQEVTPSDPIVQSVDINTKSTSYVGAAGTTAKNQPKVTSNFHPLMADPVFDGVNISIPRKVVEKEQLGETWAKKDYDEYQRLLLL